jgi:hypothetical protein
MQNRWYTTTGRILHIKIVIIPGFPRPTPDSSAVWNSRGSAAPAQRRRYSYSTCGSRENPILWSRRLMIRVGEQLIDVGVSGCPGGANSRRASWGVNTRPRVVRQRERRAPQLAPGEAGETSRRRASLRATAQHAQGQARGSSSRSRYTASSAASDARPIASVARLLKLHALGPHSEVVDRDNTQRPPSLSPVDQQLVTNATALFGTTGAAKPRKSSESELKQRAKPRKSSESELKQRPRSAAEESTRASTPASTESAHRPTFRSWIPPDKAHDMFMRSIQRERATFDQFADEEVERRDSVWLGWNQPTAVPKRTRVPTEAEVIRESLRRPTGRGFNGPQWDPTENFWPDDVRPDPERAEALLTRSRASMRGYGYDHQGYV